MNGGRIIGVGTGVPPHAVTQGEIRGAMRALFGESWDSKESLLPVFDNVKIKKRHISQPIEWFSHPHGFAEVNRLYEEVALSVSRQAALAALERARVEPRDVHKILFISSTGVAAPSVDAALIAALGIPPHVGRLPIWGLGCAGGVAGLIHGAEWARANPGKNILVISCELCSLTFQKSDDSPANLVATSLFGDGAAAVILNTQGKGPVVRGAYHHLFADTEHLMGWDLVDGGGFKVRFSRDIPSVVLEHVPRLFLKACETWGISGGEISHYTLHPGGPKILSAYEKTLGLAPERLAHSYDVLAEFGNMSSPTVLFVLERFMRENPDPGDYGIL